MPPTPEIVAQYEAEQANQSSAPDAVPERENQKKSPVTDVVAHYEAEQRAASRPQQRASAPVNPSPEEYARQRGATPGIPRPADPVSSFTEELPEVGMYDASGMPIPPLAPPAAKQGQAPQRSILEPSPGDGTLTRSVKGIGRGAKGFFYDTPVGVYHAFKDAPRDTDEQIEKEIGFNPAGIGMPSIRVGGQLGLGLNRLLVQPMIEADNRADEYQRLADQQRASGNTEAAENFWNGTQHLANAWRMGAHVPLLGPLAASSTDRMVHGDFAGGLSELVTYSVLPKVTREIIGLRPLENTPEGTTGFRAFGSSVDPATGRPVPRVAGIIGTTPKGPFAGLKVGNTRIGVRFPKSAQALGATAEVPDEAATAMLRYEQQNGERPPEASPSKPQVNLDPRNVSRLAGQLSGLNHLDRQAKIVDLHQQLADSLWRQKKFLGPDGKLHIVNSEEEAGKLAQQFINDAVTAHIEAERPAAAEPPASTLAESIARSALPKPQSSARDVQNPVLEMSPPQAGELKDQRPQSPRPVLQPTRSPVVNENLAAQAAPELQSKLAQIAAQVPGSRLARLRPQKHPARLADKIEEGKPPETISDYLAAQIAVKTPQAKDAVIAELRRKFNVVDVDDRFLDGRKDKAGYASANVQVQMANGLTAEVQIVPHEVQQITDRSHRFYTLGRNARDAGNLEAANQFFARAREINSQALERFKRRNGIGVGQQAQQRRLPDELAHLRDAFVPLTPETELEVAAKVEASREHGDEKLPDVIWANQSLTHLIWHQLGLPEPFLGLHLDAAPASELARFFEIKAASVAHSGKNLEADKLGEIAQHIRGIIDKDGSVALAWRTGHEPTDVRTAREERGHGLQSRIGNGDINNHANLEKLWAQSEEFRRATGNLGSRGGSKNITTLMIEAALKLLMNEGESLGLSRIEQNRAIRAYLESIVERNGHGSADGLKRIADPQYYQIFDEVNTHAGKKQTSGRKPSTRRY